MCCPIMSVVVDATLIIGCSVIISFRKKDDPCWFSWGKGGRVMTREVRVVVHMPWFWVFASHIHCASRGGTRNDR
jgi:hypothetical protein